MKRRNFVLKSISFSVLLAFHKEAQTLSRLTTKPSKLGSSRFREIILYTSKLEEQYEFYSEVLELPIIDKDKTQFSISIGESILRFKEVKDGSEPLYHYAINIPSNKYEKAKEWLSKKVPLIQDAETGEDLYYFDFWDAHAMYFKDPSGNIGELIARHTMDNDRDGEFGISDLLCISEIGTPVEDPSDFAAELKDAYGLGPLGSSMFIGDENGLFVVVPIDRLWFPEYIVPASVYPTGIYLSDKGPDQLKYQKYPYSIKRKK